MLWASRRASEIDAKPAMTNEPRQADPRSVAVLEVLRSCLAVDVIERHRSLLVAAPPVCVDLDRGDPFVDAVQKAFREAIEQLPTVERRVVRVMAGVESGWEPSRENTRDRRKVEMGITLASGSPDEVAEGLSTRRVEQLEVNHLAPALEAILFSQGVRTSDTLRDRAIFAQFINPEFLALHDQGQLLQAPAEVNARLSFATRMALLTSRVGLVMPASYLFEVPGVADFMNEVRAVSEVGAIQLTAPASGLEEYKAIKNEEYRDDKINPYSSSTDLAAGEQVVWRPRHGTSAGQAIADSWAREVRHGAALSGVVEAISRSRDISYRVAARNLARVPERMEGRALVSRFVFRAIKTPLPTSNQYAVRWLLSNKYLESYLDDLDAAVLVDFDFGSFSALVGDRARREISAARLGRIFGLLALDGLIKRSAGGWDELLVLRESLEIDALLPSLYRASSGEPDHMIAISRFRRANPAPDLAKDFTGYLTWLADLVAKIGL
jgi:hypothetical protein